MKTRVKAFAGLVGAIALLLAWALFSTESSSSDQTISAEGAKGSGPSLAETSGLAQATESRSTESSSKSSSPQAKETRLLMGIVSDVRGEPIVGARVRLSGLGRGLASETDAMGRYALAPVPDTAERLEVAAVGYKTHTEDKPILPSDARARWDFTLEKVDGIYGRVTLGSGEPAPFSTVILIKEKHPLGRAVASSDGDYSIEHEGELTGLEVFARHAEHGEGLTKVEAREVNVSLEGGGFVEGIVRDEQGRPIASFTITLGSEAPSAPGSKSFDDVGGKFRLGPFAAGHVSLYVAAPGYSPGRARAIVRSAEVTRGVSVTLTRSMILVGFVRDARTHRPIPGALVAPAEWATKELTEIAGATSGTSGEYRLETVPKDRTTVSISAPGYRTLLAGGIDGKERGEIRKDFELVPDADGKSGSQLTGIGVTVGKVPTGILVGEIVAGGPAVGRLNQGDVIVMVGGLDARSAPLADVVQSIRGEPGTSVDLWVRRGGTGDPEHVVLTRDIIEVPKRPHE